jgi:ParB family chromosome partitioning protein
LKALIPEQEETQTATQLAEPSHGTWVREIHVSRISPNPRQPREGFDETELKDLAASIKEHGILQPLLVRPISNGFELVSGERRLRAASIAGLDTVPAIMVSPDDSVGSLVIALVENVQRADLNALELAKAYYQLNDEFGRTQEEIAKTVGKSRSYIANTLRLLELSDPILEALQAGSITAGHARAILMAPDEAKEILFQKIVSGGLSVRQAERAAKALNNVAEKRKNEGEPEEIAIPVETGRILKEMEKALETALNRKCRIDHRKGGSGRVVLEYYDEGDLEKLVQKLT